MWSRKFDCCVKCGTTEIRHEARGYCFKCYSKRERPLGWNDTRPCCISCSGTTIKHKGQGLCDTCWIRAKRAGMSRDERHNEWLKRKHKTVTPKDVKSPNVRDSLLGLGKILGYFVEDGEKCAYVRFRTSVIPLPIRELQYL